MSTTPTLTQTQMSFRQAMAHLPAAVCIITTDGPEGRCGITASAVCSVTDSPPTVLVCVNKTSFAHDVFRKNEALCVNVLCSSQEELAKHFAGFTKVPMEERFAWDIWESGELEQPALREALVAMQGRIADSKEVGSHTVFFVEVTDIQIREQDSLVYFARNFHPVPLAA